MIFPALFFDSEADVLDNLGKPVGPDVRMGIDQDLGVGSEIDKLVKHFLYVSPL